MCLVLFALGVSEDYPFIVLANRDEFYNRPTLSAHLWPGLHGIAAGQDLLAGGTWLGLTRQGAFATVTNYSEPSPDLPYPLSRGRLVLDYLERSSTPTVGAELTPEQLDRYSGFNLVYGHIGKLWWQSNRSAQVRELPVGITGLSNRLLDTPWHKVTLAKALLHEILPKRFGTDDLFSVLANTDRPLSGFPEKNGANTPTTASSSPIFVNSNAYGTRSCTVILITRKMHVTFIERIYAPNMQLVGDTRLEFVLDNTGP